MTFDVKKIRNLLFMEAKPFILSSLGLQNIYTEEVEFQFIFGNVRVSMNRLFADFISPIVSRLHFSDPTIQSININYNIDSNQNIHVPPIEEILTTTIIKLFCDIASGKPITINKEEILSMRIISILIGNDELFEQLCQLYPIDLNHTNIDQYLSEIQKFEYLSQITNKNEFNFSSIIDLISSQFYLIDTTKLMKLPKRILYLIIKNKNLKIYNEDRLFNFINSIFYSNNNNEEDNDSYTIIDFYELLCLDYMSDEILTEFIQKLNAGEVTETIWNNFCHLLINKNSFKNQNADRYLNPFLNRFEYDGNELNAFKGIIHSMTKECGGNVHDKGVIIATSSSAKRTDVEAKYALELDNNHSYFFSENEKDSWIKYDFKEKKVIPSFYSIRSYPSSSGSEHLKNWVIEGSNDDCNWQILDSQSSVNCLNNRSAFYTFQIKKKLNLNEGFQYLRLRQTDRNATGRFDLSLSALEFFGEII